MTVGNSFPTSRLAPGSAVLGASTIDERVENAVCIQGFARSDAL